MRLSLLYLKVQRLSISNALDWEPLGYVNVCMWMCMHVWVTCVCMHACVRTCFRGQSRLSLSVVLHILSEAWSLTELNDLATINFIDPPASVPQTLALQGGTSMYHFLSWCWGSKLMSLCFTNWATSAISRVAFKLMILLLWLHAC